MATAKQTTPAAKKSAPAANKEAPAAAPAKKAAKAAVPAPAPNVVVKAAAAHRVEELKRQAKVLDEEMEFYKKDPSKAPQRLRRQVDESLESMAVQARFIVDQDAEIKRVNARFDEELGRLKSLWLLRSQPAAGAGKAAKTP